MAVFPVGKLPMDVLAGLLARNRIDDPRVLVGPRVGEDAAVIEFGDTCLVAKTDPITFATDHIGWYAVNINANDIATMGAQPKWFLATVLLPQARADAAMAQGIFDDLRSACAELGASLCGGHTEITYGLDRPIVIGQMLGEIERGRIVVNSNARPGDAIILANGIAIEATAILAREKADAVRARLGDDLWQRACNFLRVPGISVVCAARTASQAAQLAAMHDPTEGGLATGLAELADAADCGLEVDADAIPVLPESDALCRLFGIDPLGAIASGALLIVCADLDSAAVLAALRQQRIPSAVIGAMTRRDAGLLMRRDGKLAALPRFEVDEIAKLF